MIIKYLERNLEPYSGACDIFSVAPVLMTFLTKKAVTENILQAIELDSWHSGTERRELVDILVRPERFVTWSQERLIPS